MSGLSEYTQKFCSLNVNRSQGHVSPHKPCLLLALLDLFEIGKISENRILFDDVLITRYASYFNHVKTVRDHLNPWMPFFHLRGDGFWHPVPKEGRENILAGLNSARSRRDVEDNISYTFLDNELFDLLRSSDSRQVLRESLIQYWFADSVEVLRV